MRAMLLFPNQVSVEYPSFHVVCPVLICQYFGKLGFPTSIYMHIPSLFVFAT